VKAFKHSNTLLSHLDASAVATLIETASDVAMIVDQTGIIRDMAFTNDDCAQGLEGPQRSVGRPWLDMLTVESRNKAEKILSDAASGRSPQWRNVAYKGKSDSSPVPMLCSAVRIDERGLLAIFGRDQRSISALQHQLVDAQQSMERDYSKLRHIEARYRLLFQISSEAVLIVDVASQRIVELNPAAGRLFGAIGKRLLGRSFTTAFSREGTESIQTLLSGVKATGQADSTRAIIGGGASEVRVSASLFRQDNTSFFLIRLSPVQTEGSTPVLPVSTAMLLKLIDGAPDGFVVTDPEGQILMANDAFLEMVQLPNVERAVSESIERWLGRSGIDFGVLISNLRQRGSVRLFATTLRDEHGVQSDVEISAVSVINDSEKCLGFTIRGIDRRLKPDPAVPQELPRSVEQLTALVGRVSLKQLVGEATELIERLAIETALQLTDDNRVSAAEILGLSRQSLYVKLRRYGLASADASEARN